MVRFLVVESTHTDSNYRFNMSVTYLWLIILSVVADVPVNSETLLVIDFVNLKIKPTQTFECALLVTDFVNLKIKPAQTFECARRARMCVFIGKYSYMYKYLYLCYISQGKKISLNNAFLAVNNCKCREVLTLSQ
jgi:hypothetical protein